MIEKIIYSSIQTTKSIAFHTKQTNLLYRPIKNEILSNTKPLKFVQIKRLFQELKTELKAFLRKTAKKDELPPKNKFSKADIMYDEKMQKELEEQAKQRNVVKWRKEDNEKLIKKSGHSVSSGDIDQNGYLTTSGQKKVNNPAFKGKQDDLDFEETVHKELSNKEHDIGLDDLEHNYNDIIMGNHFANTAEHEADTFLTKSLKHPQEQHLTENEEHIADTVKDHIEDLNEHLFG